MLILILPIVLYPLFGSAGYLFARSMIGQESVIGVVGPEYLPVADQKWPALLNEERTIFLSQPQGENLTGGAPRVLILPEAEVEAALQARKIDVAIVIPPDFGTALSGNTSKPKVLIKSREGDDKAKLALKRAQAILTGWEQELKKERFKRAGLSEDFDKPFLIEDPQQEKPLEKKAAEELRDTFVRMFPFILFVWLVAGAIQPAVDLTAGEKERGTMETLLISPASRAEIVLGKFTAVTLFGFASVIWNVIWLTVAGGVMSGVLGFAVINYLGMLACLILGLPIAMLFSAVSLALGVFARSTKEGQYYLMPLMLFTMPLGMWSLMPGTELTLGTSLVPVTGAMLLQQKILAVNGDPVPWGLVFPVLLSLTVVIAVSLFFAILQFQRESVLFRETGPAKTGKRWWS